VKKLRTYFNFANYDKIVVNWNIEKVNGVIDNGVNEITLPYLDLDFYENAVYKFKYYAVNQYGKSEEYEYTTSTLKSVNYITQIDVDVAPTLDSATIKWNAVHSATQYDVYIFHNGITTKITVYETQYIFKPSEDGYYSFAIGVNDVVSEKTAEYYLYKKPIIGTNTVPNTPSISATYNYDRNTRKATIDITLTHSDSSDVKGTYLTIQPSGGGKEIYYFPTSTPGATENVTKEYIVTANTTFTISAYSVSVDDLISATASYNLTVVVPTSNPSIPANLTVSSHYDTNLQAPLVDIQYDAVSWEVPFTYEIAYSFDGSNWNYYTTNETSVSIIAPYGGITAYVKVRIIDVQGHQSGWSSVVSTTVANDTTAPATPAGLTATGLFQTIMVKWNKNTETDFDHYVLEYDTSDTFPAPKQIVTSSNYATLKELTVNTTYYIRIKAVDKSGNESDWSTTVSVSTVKIDDENYYDYAAIKDAIIHNGYIDSAWISELDAGLIKSGYIDADRIQAGSITSDKLVVQPANALPEGTIAYWTDSLIDVVNGIVPEGYTEVNLAPSITLTPYNAPEGSVVGDLLAGNKIYAGKSIQVGNKVFIENTSSDKGQIRVNSGGIDIVKIGESVLDDSSDGIAIFNGKLQIKNSDNSKTLIGASGIRQIYNISLVDQLDSTHGLDIPIYIPQNTDGTSVSSGTARIIVKVEKYRAYSKGTASGGSSAPTTSTVWNSSGDYLNTTTGEAAEPQVITSANSHYHGDGSLTTNLTGSHDHSYYGIPTGSQGLTGDAGSHSHIVSGNTSSSSHTHSIDAADIASSHYHEIDKYWLRHSHTVSIPSHTHGLSYGIYESSATATVTIKKGSTTIGTVTTGNKGNFSNVSVSDGDIISITANNLARVQVYIFVEYYLR
jgi:hypothetical protein